MNSSTCSPANSRYSNGASAAFFDVDNTLINIKSMFSFLDYIEETCSECAKRMHQHKYQLSVLAKNQFKREYINRFYYSVFSGLEVSTVHGWGEDWYKKICEMDGFFIDKSIRLLRMHQSEFRPVIFVSGSFNVLLNPIARELSVSDVIATDLEIVDGCYTGKLLNDPTIGFGKFKKIRSYAINNKINLNLSYAYGDDVSDLNMLSAVGFPGIVNPNYEILKQAPNYIRNNVELLSI